MAGMNKTVIELPAGIDAALGVVAERTGRTCPDLVIEALLAFLDEQQRADETLIYPLPLSIGIIADAEVSGANFEDWLEANWRPEEDWGRE